MTGGLVVILGEVGPNFGAGMTGGMAFIYDPANTFDHQANPETIIWQSVETEYWQDVLKVQIQQHVKRTHSKHALRLLNDWARVLPHFRQIVPQEMIGKLEHPLTLDEETGLKSAGE
jgi:glutamate synthase (NADPH) large chain